LPVYVPRLSTTPRCPAVRRSWG